MRPLRGRRLASNGATPALTVRTVNVQQRLAASLATTLASAKEDSVQVVVFQETGVHIDGRASVRRAAASCGFTTVFGAHTQRGCYVAAMATCPIAEYVPPAEFGTESRVMFAQIDRPQQRPLLLANVYGHATNDTERDRLLRKVATYLRSTGEATLLIGDLNCTEEEGAVGEICANGIMHLADDFFDGPRLPTRESGRRIDFALCSADITFTQRSQTPGPADHDTVAYSICLRPDVAPRHMAPVPPKLRRVTPVSSDEFLHYYATDGTSYGRTATLQQRFQMAINSGDPDAAWTVLSDLAEYLLAAEPQDQTALGGHPRSQPWQPQQIPTGGKRHRSLKPSRLRRLRRIHRRVREFLAAHPAQGCTSAAPASVHVATAFASSSAEQQRNQHRPSAQSDQPAFQPARGGVGDTSDTLVKRGQSVHLPPLEPPLSGNKT